MFSHTLTIKWSQNGAVITNDVVSEADGEDNREIEVADDAADVLVAFSADVQEIKSLFIRCDQDITIKTNSSTEPADTLNIKADKPLIWNDDDGYFACPFSVDITAIYITNASDPATDGTLSIRMLVDSTV